MERWEVIPDYERMYLVSNLGRIRAIFINKQPGSRGRRFVLNDTILAQYASFNGYYKVHLNTGLKTARSKTASVHRLVAMAFIDNPDNLKEVNHKNGIKSDNRVENLEWVTRHRNMNHSVEIGIRGGGKRKVVLNLNTGIFYDSIVQASKYSHINKNTFYNMVTNKCKNKTNFIVC
jgi:hypothetical protein